MMKIVGQILMWAGFLSGSLATVYQYKGPTPAETVPPVWFGVSVAIGFAGVVLLWVHRFKNKDDKETSTTEFNSLKDTIASLVASCRELNESQTKMAPSEIVAAIDNNTAMDFQTFAENRKVLIPRFGLQVYASVMTQFSAAERAMNRAWSAAADGYLDEVETCLEKSGTHLEETDKLIRELDEVYGSSSAKDPSSD